MPGKDTRSASKRARGGAGGGLSIVVPLFNEANGLERLHARIVAVAETLKAKRGLPIELVYVDAAE